MNLNFRFFSLTLTMLPCVLACTPTASQPPVLPPETALPAKIKEASIPKTNPQQDSAENLLNILDPETNTYGKALEKAQAAQSEGKPERALFYYVKALQLNPNDVAVREQIAAIHEQSNKLEAALKVYQDILKIDKNNAVANETLGLNYLKNRLYDQAKQHLETAIAQDDNR